jgi:predicted acetyltransferase
MDRLPGYVAALEAGWSPNNTHDVSGEQLAAIREDAGAFLRDLTRREGGGTVTLADGTAVPRLPGRVFWLWDGEFCGVINLRFVPGTPDLPPHVSGHLGYAVVPWKRQRGYATRALALLLPVARGLGLPACWSPATRATPPRAGSSRRTAASRRAAPRTRTDPASTFCCSG